MNFNHTSVLLNECIQGLNIKKDGIYVDGTAGGGGHSMLIAEQLSKVSSKDQLKGHLIGIDRDGQAVISARKALEDYSDICTIVNGNFSCMDNILDSLDISLVDGILLDLGVSSFQLDTPERGFSYMHDAPLDMRMDRNDHLTAYDIVNEYDIDRLNTIIYKYGEERWAKRIAAFIIENRKEKPIETTGELVSIIKSAIPKNARSDGPHPAKRTFQAIRIEVNDELNILDKSIRNMTNRLKTGGRLCIITFHSLEDRIVKNVFKELESPCNCPREFPVCVCNKKASVKIITRKPITPSEKETNNNHRARSAKLRIIEKI